MPITKIPLTGKYGKGKYALVDGDYDGEYFSQFNWKLTPGGYVYRTDYYDGGQQRISYLHREVAAPPKRIWVQWKDGNKLNNRSCNLVWRTPSQVRKSHSQSNK